MLVFRAKVCASDIQNKQTDTKEEKKGGRNWEIGTDTYIHATDTMCKIDY